MICDSVGTVGDYILKYTLDDPAVSAWIPYWWTGWSPLNSGGIQCTTQSHTHLSYIYCQLIHGLKWDTCTVTVEDAGRATDSWFHLSEVKISSAHS